MGLEKNGFMFHCAFIFCIRHKYTQFYFKYKNTLLFLKRTYKFTYRKQICQVKYMSED